MITYDTLERLQQIKDTIKELVYEARDLLPRNTIENTRAKSYWIPHILMALDTEHDYLGGSMCTIQETINDLESRIEHGDLRDELMLEDELERD